MNLAKIVSRHQRNLQYLLILGIATAVVVGLAQTPNSKSGRILVDGRINPEKIPDWILWNHIFLMAANLDNKSSTHGKELWIDRLHLEQRVMNQIIDHGYEQLEMADDARKKADKYVADSKKDKPELIDNPKKNDGLRIKLKEVRMYKESRTLEIRDKLRERIGDDAYLRLSSFARLQIAPNVIIGN